jgi:hypothetical protein
MSALVEVMEPISVERPMKTCACGNTFPVEYNSRGQITSRKLCDRCREKRNTRTTRALPSTRGVPRCIDCTALVGPQWGTVTHLDPDGRCPSCSNWYQKRTYIAERERMGYRFVGGMFFLRPLPRLRARRKH